MSTNNKRPIGNGFLAMIVLVIFISGIATMLISGHNLKTVTGEEPATTDSTVSQPQAVVSANTNTSSTQPNAFEDKSNLPDDYKLISIRNEEVNKGPLILVNYQYESCIDGENLVNLYENASDSFGVKNDDMYINDIVMKHMNEMFDDFKEAKGSSSILISSSYRSKQYQQEVYDQSVKDTGKASTAYYVAVPGHSEHQTGYCFDTATYNYLGEMVELDGEGTFSWLIENCCDYGMVLRYPDDKTNITGIGYESWHFRYVGVPHSCFIKDNSLCLEEYIAGIKSYTFADGGLLIDKGDKGKWVVYYVPKLEAFNTTDIPVPVDSTKTPYTISGDNIGGFIVTVDVSKDSANSLLKNAKTEWSFDSSSLVIVDFKDYIPGEEDSDSDSDSDDWKNDSFWNDGSDEDTEEYDYDDEFEYEDYYDEYEEDSGSQENDGNISN